MANEAHDQASGDSLSENLVWHKVDGLWTPLYGGFSSHGVSVEWHEFHVDSPLDWSRSFHPRSLEICLNYTGSADLREAGASERLANEQVAAYAVRDELVGAVREMGTIHRFFTIELAPEYLLKQLESVLDGVKPEVRKFLENPERFTPWVRMQVLPVSLLALRQPLLEPPVSNAARDIWYSGKIQEILASTLFLPDKPAELFCKRHKRINAERVERARFLLERDLCNPPSLEMLGQEVDCSPFYLSRLFTDQLGTSIPKYLRERRIERAAEMILGQGMSVTDAAMAVGYSSLSAFNKAFVNRFGQAPGAYGKASAHRRRAQS